MAQSILDRVERYLVQSGMAPTAFGRAALRDAELVNELRQGRDLRQSTAQKVIDWIRANPARRARVKPGKTKQGEPDA